MPHVSLQKDVPRTLGKAGIEVHGIAVDCPVHSDPLFRALHDNGFREMGGGQFETEFGMAVRMAVFAASDRLPDIVWEAPEVSV